MATDATHLESGNGSMKSSTHVVERIRLNAARSAAKIFTRLSPRRRRPRRTYRSSMRLPRFTARRPAAPRRSCAALTLRRRRRCHRQVADAATRNHIPWTDTYVVRAPLGVTPTRRGGYSYTIVRWVRERRCDTCRPREAAYQTCFDSCTTRFCLRPHLNRNPSIARARTAGPPGIACLHVIRCRSLPAP